MKTAVCCWHRTASGQLNDQMIPFYQQITHIFSWMILKGVPLLRLHSKRWYFVPKNLGKMKATYEAKLFCWWSVVTSLCLSWNFWRDAVFEIFFSSRYISPFEFRVKPTSPGKHHKTWDDRIKGWLVETNTVLASWMSLWVTIWQLAESSVCGIVLFLLVP